MTAYMVVRNSTGITFEELAQTQQAAVEASRHFTARGKPVRYIRSSWIPSESRFMSLFEAKDIQTVRAVNEVAGLPFTGVHEAIDFIPGKEDEMMKRSFYILTSGIGACWIISMTILAFYG